MDGQQFELAMLVSIGAKLSKELKGVDLVLMVMMIFFLTRDVVWNLSRLGPKYELENFRIRNNLKFKTKLLHEKEK